MRIVLSSLSISLPGCYAMHGTDLVYDATIRFCSLRSTWLPRMQCKPPLSACALSRTTVPRAAISLQASYAMSGTSGLGYLMSATHTAYAARLLVVKSDTDLVYAPTSMSGAETRISGLRNVKERKTLLVLFGRMVALACYAMSGTDSVLAYSSRSVQAYRTAVLNAALSAEGYALWLRDARY
eukprot:1116817-Rhodomonas_salina.3